jgi:hypothetical protein
MLNYNIFQPKILRITFKMSASPKSNLEVVFGAMTFGKPSKSPFPLPSKHY